MFKILIDADACPQTIKEILYRAAKRLSVPLFVVANQRFTIPVANNIKFVQVAKGFDEADRYITSVSEVDDLIITADIPLAAAVIEKGAYALNPRGEFYSADNIKQILAVRNLMHELRNTGQITGGPAGMKARDQQAFANALDNYLNKKLNK